MLTYQERRRRNNIASRRSTQLAKIRNQAQEQTRRQLEQEHQNLRLRLEIHSKEFMFLRALWNLHMDPTVLHPIPSEVHDVLNEILGPNYPTIFHTLNNLDHKDTEQNVVQLDHSYAKQS